MHWGQWTACFWTFLDEGSKTQAIDPFLVDAPKLWNSPPFDVRAAQPLEQFRTKLKTHFLSLDSGHWLFLVQTLYFLLFYFTYFIIHLILVKAIFLSSSISTNILFFISTHPVLPKDLKFAMRKYVPDYNTFGCNSRQWICIIINT